MFKNMDQKIFIVFSIQFGSLRISTVELALNLSQLTKSQLELVRCVLLVNWPKIFNGEVKGLICS